MAENLLNYASDLNEDDKKAIRFAVDYETWREIRRNESYLYFLSRETVIAALRKAGARACEPIEIACLAAADKLACDNSGFEREALMARRLSAEGREQLQAQT
jgi:hypothetical protein